MTSAGPVEVEVEVDEELPATIGVVLADVDTEMMPAGAEAVVVVTPTGEDTEELGSGITVAVETATVVLGVMVVVT